MLLKAAGALNQHKCVWAPRRGWEGRGRGPGTPQPLERRAAGLLINAEAEICGKWGLFRLRLAEQRVCAGVAVGCRSCSGARWARGDRAARSPTLCSFSPWSAVNWPFPIYYLLFCINDGSILQRYLEAAVKGPTWSRVSQRCPGGGSPCPAEFTAQFQPPSRFIRGLTQIA